MENDIETKRYRDALDYITVVAMKKNPHLGRPRTSDKECIFCLAYLALNDGVYGESFDYETLAKQMRDGFKPTPTEPLQG